jgi:hypothetical protein
LRQPVGWRAPLILLAVLMAASACGGTRSDPDRPDPRARQPIRLQVENQNYLDMVVSVDMGGQVIRLSMVVGNNSASMEIPSSVYMTGPIQLLAEPIGPRGGYRSDFLSLSPGDRVIFRIGPQLELSSVVLR